MIGILVIYSLGMAQSESRSSNTDADPGKCRALEPKADTDELKLFSRLIICEVMCADLPGQLMLQQHLCDDGR